VGPIAGLDDVEKRIFFNRCLHPIAYIAVSNLCYRLCTAFLFIVLFSTLRVSTSAGHHQVFHIYHTTIVENKTINKKTVRRR
jgi:hypothetical protein